ncbi:hypothetical protein VCHA53O466_50309 [Vibrio chagasii]|nr:hypothetical protein VCHA53O466_50309 [Vibrio chagasii]
MKSDLGLSVSEKNVFKEAFLKTWVERYQRLSTKPALLGMVHPSNLVSEYDQEYFNKGSRMWNTMRIYDEYQNYCKEFEAYLQICEEDNEPVYPSVEYFLRNLYISGSYEFLNLKPIRGTEVELLVNGEVHILSHIHVGDKEHGKSGYWVTRHYHNGVMRNYAGWLVALDELDESLLVLETRAENICPDKFKDTFHPTKFRRALDLEEPIEFMFHKFISEITCIEARRNTVDKRHYSKRKQHLEYGRGHGGKVRYCSKPEARNCVPYEDVFLTSGGTNKVSVGDMIATPNGEEVVVSIYCNPHFNTTNVETKNGRGTK